MVNRYGTCPHCGENWDGGDIRNHIQTMSANAFKSEKDIDAMAADYGWTPENKKRFSLVSTYEVTFPLTKSVFIECPSCMHVWDELSEEHYLNMADARDLNPIQVEVNKEQEDFGDVELEEDEDIEEDDSKEYWLPPFDI